MCCRYLYKAKLPPPHPSVFRNRFQNTTAPSPGLRPLEPCAEKKAFQEKARPERGSLSSGEVPLRRSGPPLHVASGSSFTPLPRAGGSDGHLQGLAVCRGPLGQPPSPPPPPTGSPCRGQRSVARATLPRNTVCFQARYSIVL